MPRRSQRQAVEQRTRARLDEQRERRREAARRGVETRRRNRAQAAQGAPGREVAPQVAEEQPERPQRNVVQNRPPHDRAAMVTVALRGEPAARLRALAASQELSLAKLLVRMMDSLEAQAR